MENITWVITYPDVSGPTYIIYQNGTQITSQSWVSNVPIVIQVGTLDVGSYNYTIIATDGLGANVSDQVIVGVIADVPPQITHPNDFQFVKGSGNQNITWIITDPMCPTRYM